MLAPEENLRPILIKQAKINKAIKEREQEPESLSRAPAQELKQSGVGWEARDVLLRLQLQQNRWGSFVRNAGSCAPLPEIRIQQNWSMTITDLFNSSLK